MNKLVAFLASTCLAAAAHAAPPRTESVEALLVATKSESLIDGMYANLEQYMRQSMAAAAQGQPMTAEQQRVLDAVPAKFSAVIRQEMAWSKMRPIYVQIYQESFSQEEIDGLLAFYRSPAGQAFVAKMPVVMQKSMQVLQAQMGPLMARMKTAMDEAVSEAKRAK